MVKAESEFQKFDIFILSCALWALFQSGLFLFVQEERWKVFDEQGSLTSTFEDGDKCQT